MYYRLKSEILYKGYTMKEFALKCEIPYPSWLRKMKQQSFTLREAKIIKQNLETTLLLEELFEWEEREERK